MKFIIAGAGSVGYDIARHLIKEGMDVVIIEKDTVRAKFLESDLDCIVLNREINSIQTLKDADIQAGDYFIAVTESDEVNLIACSIASTFENVKKIARVRNLEYSHAEVFGRPFLGADYVISPEIEAAKQITEIIDRGAATDVLTFEGTDITVRAGIIEKNSIFKNKSLMKIRREINRQFIIALIKRGDKEIIPSGNTVLREGDTIFIVADSEAMNYILAKTGKRALKVKSALIVGTTRIARNLLRTLSVKPIDLKIVVENYDEAKELSRTFPNVLVINGDVRNESLFEEEKLNEVDLIVTVTDNQELNVITALYAKSTGVDRAVAAVSKQSYMSIAQKLGVDVTISPKKSAVDAILKYIRRGNIKTFHSLLEGDAEAIEFVVPEKCVAVGKLIRELKMPFDSIIAAISRNGKVFIPDGSFQLQKEDSIIVILKSSVASKVETIFANTNEI
ncbi:MAG TPA: Trk system potassium transporter TrkA [bacterium]|jgi:trk system potassium uptake protein TrkA|nr:Trk system potassium transporter TrkA [bacterium]MDX9806348.1 Trk system potassium transporter TrkA [bacterium]HNW16675.1 Trk system potassium transporter TrkA [bacterium]HNZ53314.1 Trk system potassium transporter TrkA [bacterium]HOG42445.1 Trk system potassium transporter TrkA [bacterium]